MQNLSDVEFNHIERVLAKVCDCVQGEKKILLPSLRSDDPPLKSSNGVAMAVVSGEYSGMAGEFAYQFEGEEDLLHLFITRNDETAISVEEAQGVVSLLLPSLPKALIWLKQGTYSQHFYFGHDELLNFSS